MAYFAVCTSCNDLAFILTVADRLEHGSGKYDCAPSHCPIKVKNKTVFLARKSTHFFCISHTKSKTYYYVLSCRTWHFQGKKTLIMLAQTANSSMAGSCQVFSQEIFQSRHETKISVGTTCNKPICCFSDRLSCTVYNEKQTNVSELFQLRRQHLY